MIMPATYVGPKHPPQDPSIVPVMTRVSRKRRSPYRELLERLLDSPKNSVLRVKNVGARYAFRKQARALGYEAVFARHDGWLYVKIGGVLNQERQPEGQRANAAQESVLNAFANGPMTATEVARMLKSDSASCEAVLSHLVEAGFVERDDGLGKAIYRAMPGVKYGK
jgi:Fic family protein